MKKSISLAAAMIFSLAVFPAAAEDFSGYDLSGVSSRTSSMIPDYQENEENFYTTADYVPLRGDTISLPGLSVPSHPAMVGASVRFYLDRRSIRPADAGHPGQVSMNVAAVIHRTVGPRYNGFSLYRIRLVMSYDSITPSSVTVTAYPLINAIDGQGQVQYRRLSPSAVQRLKNELFINKTAAYAAAYAYSQVFGKNLPAQADYTFRTE